MMTTLAPEDQGHLEVLMGILQNPERQILPLFSGSKKDDDDDDDDVNNRTSDTAQQQKNETLKLLLNISKGLFEDIESLGVQYQDLVRKRKNNATSTSTTITTTTTTLSGLTELFLPPDMEPNDTDLPETIFGQVDLQNTSLKKLIRKSTKRLAESTGNIRILDMGIMESDDDKSDDGGEDDDSNNNSDDQREGRENEHDTSHDDNDDDEEEVERRMRERMERAMEDMEDEDESLGDEVMVDIKTGPSKKEKDEDIYDPIAEDMKDGFFDLNEMEEFADEEEDYLPEEAFGQPTDDENIENKKNSKKSFHQKQRDGDFDSDDSENNERDDDDFDDLYEEVKEVKRKQYRDQEDIDALYSLYQEANSDDENDAVANMTAADYFGAPKKEYIERYKKKHPSKKNSKQSGEFDDDDDDSWGDYDFEREDQAGTEWRDGDDSDDEDGDAFEAANQKDEGDDDDGQEEADDDDENEGANAKAKKSGINLKVYKQEEKLRRQTEELEKELLAEKPWQMTGETKSTSRPVNSLLEGTPEFEMASKQAPTITVEHTANLEDVIKKRILAEDWDDVVPRELPDVGWNKKRGETPEVSQEKSKLGLGELYEREYLKKAVGYDKDAAEKQTEEDKAKDEMKQLFAGLCSKLDALSNYHFAPRPIADEAEVRPVTAPAIAMEEVLPLHVSDARGVAPEEVYATKRGREGILRADSEMDQNDRKRQRQSKKAARRKARKEKQADEKLISRLQPGLGLNNPYEKRKAREELAQARARGKVTTGEQDMDTKFGSSGTFFKRLQAEAQQTIQASNSSEQPHEKKSKPKSSAYKL